MTNAATRDKGQGHEPKMPEDRALMLAHELRSPLSTLALSLAVLRRDDGLGEAQREQRYDVMQRQIDHLSSVIESTMEIGRATHGQASPRLLPLDLNALVAEALEVAGGSIASKRQHIALHRSVRPLWVLGDPTRLKQVFANLIENAVRYTHEGGRIDVTLDRQAEAAVVVVADNGRGIAAGDLTAIFEPFVQGAWAAGGGLGLGLALVRLYVGEHAGRVTAASAGPACGSRFTVQLPLHACGTGSSAPGKTA